MSAFFNFPQLLPHLWALHYVRLYNTSSLRLSRFLARLDRTVGPGCGGSVAIPRDQAANRLRNATQSSLISPCICFTPVMSITCTFSLGDCPRIAQDWLGLRGRPGSDAWHTCPAARLTYMPPILDLSRQRWSSRPMSDQLQQHHSLLQLCR